MKITIIGAGPAGSFSAYLLAKQGHAVSVYEEQPTVGIPWACTGVITGDVLSRMMQLPKDTIINKIEKARIFSPSGDHVEVKLKNDIVVNRAGMDQHLAEKAKDAGARYYVNHRFLQLTKNNGSVEAAIKNKNTGKLINVESDYLIGADGPRSSVAKEAGLFENRKFYVGLQVTAKHENDNAINFYPSEEGIAWSVPENEHIVRAGIAANKHANVYLSSFLSTVLGKNYKDKITGNQAGPIPVYNPKSRAAKGRVMLAGDAAGMVKATTLGGINQSLMAAKAIADAIDGKGSYEKLWKAQLARDLWISLMMRKAMNKFSNKDYDKLVHIFTAEKNKKVLETFDRDEPRKFAMKILLQEPRLLLLSRKILF